MTDAEIMKALGICSSEHLGCEDGCPYTDVPHCYFKGALLKDALALINRQKAEIERLKKAGEEAVSCFNRMESLYKIKGKELEVAKTEAIKEFWDRLKAEKFIHKNFGELVYVEDGDNLAKEMTE